MTKRRTVIYAALLVMVTALWCFTHSDRAKVRRVFADVERLAAKESGESVMECAAKSRSLACQFKDGCEIVNLGPGLNAVYSRDDISGGLLAFRSSATRITVQFRKLEISFNDGIARVEGLVDYTGTEATWPRYEPKAKQFLAHLEKIDGQWLISRIKVP